MAKMFKILWPEHRFISAEQLISWAKDDVANGLAAGPVANLEDACTILAMTGSVTFAKDCLTPRYAVPAKSYEDAMRQMDTPDELI